MDANNGSHGGVDRDGKGTVAERARMVVAMTVTTAVMAATVATV